MTIKWVGAHPNNFQVGRANYKVKYVVLHWIVGSLESADAAFQKPDRIASATYGIGDTDVHQYVKEEDTSYANNNLLSNRQSITIEHEGGWLLDDGVSRFKPTDATHETSAQLVADICKRYDIPIDRDHIKKHSEVGDRPTECPGLLDIGKIVSRARDLNSQPAQPQGGDDMPNFFDKNDDNAWRIAIAISYDKNTDSVAYEEVVNAKNSALTPFDWLKADLKLRVFPLVKEEAITNYVKEHTNTAPTTSDPPTTTPSVPPTESSTTPTTGEQQTDGTTSTPSDMGTSGSGGWSFSWQNLLDWLKKLFKRRW